MRSFYFVYQHPIWSSGQDTWLSPRRLGFDSRYGRIIFSCTPSLPMVNLIKQHYVCSPNMHECMTSLRSLGINQVRSWFNFCYRENGYPFRLPLSQFCLIIMGGIGYSQNWVTYHVIQKKNKVTTNDSNDFCVGQNLKYFKYNEL